MGHGGASGRWCRLCIPRVDTSVKLTASTGTLANPFQYTGREFDLETGIYEYRVRYYDQTVGRFVSEDPIGFRGGIDFYAYVLENPPNLTYPKGAAPRARRAPPSAVSYATPATLP